MAAWIRVVAVFSVTHAFSGIVLQKSESMGGRKMSNNGGQFLESKFSNQYEVGNLAVPTPCCTRRGTIGPLDAIT